MAALIFSVRISPLHLVRQGRGGGDGTVGVGVGGNGKESKVLYASREMFQVAVDCRWARA
jgi:hypothetical protein